MLKQVMRNIYLASGIDETAAGEVVYRLYKGRWRDRPIEPVARPDTDGVPVAFRITGGMGDHLIAARYVRDLLSAVGEFRFDVYSPRREFATWIFGGMPQLNNVYDEYFSWHRHAFFQYYPLAISVSGFVVVQLETLKTLRLHARNPKLVTVCEMIDQFRRTHALEEIIRVHPLLDGHFATKAIFTNLNRHNVAQEMSGIAYGGHLFPVPIDRDAPEKFGLQGQPYLTIHNGFDAYFQTGHGYARKSTKVYPYFAEALSSLRQSHPDVVVVQLGSATSQPIGGVDRQLIGRSSPAETAAILAGSTLHVDNESGLVHLAACLGITSCVLFGPTPAAYFGYEHNINIVPNACGGCWWATPHWMTSCSRGFEKPICLAKTSPQTVATALGEFLDRSKPPLAEFADA